MAFVFTKTNGMELIYSSLFIFLFLPSNWNVIHPPFAIEYKSAPEAFPWSKFSMKKADSTISSFDKFSIFFIFLNDFKTDPVSRREYAAELPKPAY